MKSLQQKFGPKLVRNLRKYPAKQAIFVVLCIFGLVQARLTPGGQAESLTLPVDQRPSWLRRDGIVMAGSWEPLLFRVRRDGQDGYKPTAEQQAAYLREHSPEMVAQLKDLGVNFVMMHCYKGAGLAAERQSMNDAVQFAKLCHDAGLHVGVYTYSGAFLWEPLFKEVPQANEWVLLDGNGKPRTYGSVTYRYYWNRNHPDAQAFYRGIVSFAINKIGADLLHFDNYGAGPGYDLNSAQRLRQYLRDMFTGQQMKDAGIDNVNTVQPAIAGPPDNLLRRAWLDFSCQSLADSYHQISRYARMLRKDILIECNPGGPGNHISSPIDHGRLLQGGEAFWDESGQSGYNNGQLHTRIRTYKVARRMDNMAFTYTTTPLEMAESMAFNTDCLGCICWFEYAKIVARPGSKDPVSATIAPFIQFFHNHRDLLRDSKVVADVAILRSFPSQVFADSKYAKLTYEVERALIDNHICFQIIYSQHLDDLKRYPALILAGCVAISDDHIKQIERYVQSGGRLCIIGPVGTHDEWMLPRIEPAFERPAQRWAEVVRVDENGDISSAIRQACDNNFSLSIRARPGLCCELTEQAGIGTPLTTLRSCASLQSTSCGNPRRLVHLVNYHPDSMKNIAVTVRLPVGRNAKTVVLVSPEHQQDIQLPFEVRSGRVEFTVPEVNVYEIAVITMRDPAKREPK